MVQEDDALVRLVYEESLEENGHTQTTKSPAWTIVAERLNNGRNPKQCRERWSNYLRPGIKKGNWTYAEEQLIIDMHNAFGPKYVYR
jgi:hypothetical protein